MTETDANKNRPRSYVEEETIEVKPSTELIPDEYERRNNKSVLVELICRGDDEDVQDLAEELKNLGFEINKTDIHRQGINNETSVLNFVTNVNKKVSENSYDGLLMIFAKVQLRNEILKKIWGEFTSAKCPALKNKPKIFIFQILKPGISKDSSQMSLQIDSKVAYDTPAEADILIVYDKYLSGSENDFFENLCENVKDYALQEHIINLVSLSIGPRSRPLIISTMTRNFFFTLHQYRGHHYSINENHNEIKESLQSIKDYVKTITEHQHKEKEKSLKNKSFSFRKAFSFRTKTQREKEADSDDNKVNLKTPKEEKEKPSAAMPKKKPTPITPPVDNAIPIPNKSPRRKSSASIPSTPTRKISNSTSHFGSKEEMGKKPPWR